MIVHIQVLQVLLNKGVVTISCKEPLLDQLWCWYSNSISLEQESTVLVIIKLTNFVVALRLRCGSCKCFAKFKNVVHSLEPGETPSYSASHEALKYVQRS